MSEASHILVLVIPNRHLLVVNLETADVGGVIVLVTLLVTQRVVHCNHTPLV